MVKLRFDNQIITAQSDVLISEGKVFVDGEPVDIVFPGEFTIEIVEGEMSVDDSGDVLYENETE